VSDTTAGNSANDLLLTRLADEFAARYRLGERPSIQEYINRHPELADEIRELFPAVVEIEQAGEDQHETAEQADAPPATALQQLGDFRIIREVGKGGMGIVYEAEQVSLGRHVALKVLPKTMRLDAKAKSRFEREAKSAAKLHHTNIVPVFGVGEHDGTPYYVMQFIQGLGLDEVLEELKKLQFAHGKAGMTTGGEPRVSQNLGQASHAFGEKQQSENARTGQLSAATLARSLFTDGLGATELFQSERDETEGREAAVSEARERAPVPGSPVLSDSFTVSSSFGVMPERSRDGSKAKSKNPNYWRRVASIGVQVADALEYAHKQGVHHRDIKPSNLLVDMQGTVWVTDFGLAKASDADNLTHTGDIVGTIRYMGPERFQGKSDARSDVYALGLTIYELLAMRAAFDERDRPKLMHQVLHEEPPRLRTVNRAVPRDLETIVHKAIAKEPSQRYPSAAALAQDLQCFVEDRPILARRASSRERLWRWCRRNPATAAFFVMTVLALVALAGASAILWSRSRLERAYLAEAQARGDAERQRSVAQAHKVIADEERRKAEEAHRETRKALDLANNYAYYHRIALADTALRHSDLLRAEQLLDDCPAELRHWEWGYLKNQCHVDLLTIQAAPRGTYTHMALSPDGRMAATAGMDRTPLKLWDLEGEKPVWSADHGQNGIHAVAYHPDGKQIATAGIDGTIKLWNAQTGKAIATWRGHGAEVIRVRYRPDGRQLGSASRDGSVRLWNVETGSQERILLDHSNAVIDLSFSRDGRVLASAGWDGTVRRWSLESPNAEVLAIQPAAGSLTAVAMSPDGHLIASGGIDSLINIWDAQDGRLLQTLRGHEFTIQQLMFSPDGNTLASSSSDATVRTWNVARGVARSTYRGHQGHVLNVAFHPDGDRLVSSGLDGSLRVWNALADPPASRIKGGASIHETRVGFSPDGRWLLTAGIQPVVALRDVETGEIARSLQPISDSPSQNTAVHSFSEDGSQVAVRAPGHPVTIFDTASGHVLQTIASEDWRQSHSWDWDSKSHTLALGAVDGSIRLLDSRNGQQRSRIERFPGAVHDLAFSPRGRFLAAVNEGARVIHVWDPSTQTLLQQLGTSASGFVRARFSLDEQLVAATTPDGEVLVWETSGGKLLHTLRGHQGWVRELAFSPDGRRLATCGSDRTVRLWDVASGQEALTLRNLRHLGTGVAFSPDGRLLAASDSSQLALIWHGGNLVASAADRRAALERLRVPGIRARAEEALESGQWASALWFYDRLIKTRTEAGLFAGSGMAHANLDQWEPAAANFRRAIDLPGANLQVWVFCALVCTKQKDLDGSRHAITGMLKRFGATDNLELANNLAWACALAPDAVSDWKRPLELAEKAAAKGRNAEALNTLGAVEVRAERERDAIQHLQEGMKLQGKGGTAWDWLFLAIAHFQLGQPMEAQTCLAKAVAWIDEATRTKPTGSVKSSNLSWSQRLELQLLRGEAEALIKEKNQ
jgi:eukaryotic-like serine/threonine-protein kinase